MRTIYHITLFTFFTLFASTSVAQCDTLRHNGSWFEGWISCEETASPNSERGVGHWILYDFNQIYTLYEMHVWNTNAPELLNYGMQNVVIDISSDGETWTEQGSYIFPQGTGDSRYPGVDVMSFDSTAAQFVLITAIDNYGGSCYGISEVRIRARERCIDDRIIWVAGDGNWNVPANWCSNTVPTQDDEVVIPSDVLVIVPLLYTAHVWNIEIKPGAELKVIGNFNAHQSD